MKIKLLVPRTGPAGAFNRGEEIEVSAAEAKRMFEADPPQAVPVREAAGVETAARQPGKGKAKG